jgi:hypothetical protein
MLQLDHLSIIAPSLEEGVAHVRACLDIDVPFGRVHRDMGTHNHLLRLGDDGYLEVIAVDPGAPVPQHPRWFGLDDSRDVRNAWERGHRLRGWVARTDDIDAVLRTHESVLGRKTRLTSGQIIYHFAIPPGGALPLNGVAPSVIDRGGRPPSIAAMPDLGARLRSFVLEHPQPDDVTALYAKLGIANPPRVMMGHHIRYRAEIETPRGVKHLS